VWLALMEFIDLWVTHRLIDSVSRWNAVVTLGRALTKRAAEFATELLARIRSAEFVQERCCSAWSKEVSPILFVHSRVLTPSGWSL
jgi:hypothetical protein